MNEKETILSVLQEIRDLLKIEKKTKSEYFEITECPHLKTSDILNLLKSKFPVWSYYLDGQLDKDFPAPKETTVRYFKKSIEPDQETLGLSVREFENRFSSSTGITLRERLLMELSYFEETGNHLDIKGITFCSGSRYSGGRVPGVYFSSDGKVDVYGCILDDSHAKYGIRRAVTL